MSPSDFWTRRRASVAAEEDNERAATAAAEVATEREQLAQKSDEAILAELELPDPDTLGRGDDFSGFMKAVVPERLKRRALRRLWATNPVLANLDGLVDYGEDFTDAATVMENLTTAYQVGKGMTKHVEEMLRQMDPEEQEEESPEKGAASQDGAPVDEEEPVDDPSEGSEIAEIAQNLGNSTAPPGGEQTNFVEDERNHYAPIGRMRYRYE